SRASVDLRDTHALPTRRSSDLFVPARLRDLAEAPVAVPVAVEPGLEGVDKLFAALWFLEALQSRGRLLRAKPLKERRVAFEHLRSEEHTSELQSRENLVCRLLL